ncbi:MAG: hypothetical protein WCI03_03730 [bacterium]
MENKLTDSDGMLHAHAVPIHGPAYLVKLNRKAADNLERLSREHDITPEDALTVAALVMLKCGSGDCWAGDCFRELLQETNEPDFKFIHAAGSGRKRA